MFPHARRKARVRNPLAYHSALLPFVD